MADPKAELKPCKVCGVLFISRPLQLAEYEFPERRQICHKCEAKLDIARRLISVIADLNEALESAEKHRLEEKVSYGVRSAICELVEVRQLLSEWAEKKGAKGTEIWKKDEG